MGRQYVQCEKSKTVADLWEKCADRKMQLTKTYLVPISEKQQSKHNFVEVPLVFPLSLILHNEVWYLGQKPKKTDEGSLTNNVPSVNALELLMKSANSKQSIKLVDETNNKKKELYNDLIKLTEAMCPNNMVKDFEKVLQNVTNALWSIDGNYQKFVSVAANGHCKLLPKYFETLYENSYRNFKAQKKAKPSLTSEDLVRQSNSLFDSMIYFQGIEKINKTFFDACRQLAESMKSYAEYLIKAQERTQSNRAESISHSFTERETVVQIDGTSKVKAEYKKLDQYESVCVDGDFVPEDRKMRYLWFKDLKLSHR